MGSNPILGSINFLHVIISRPKTNTVISFGMFLVIALVVTAMNAIPIFQGAPTAWYNFAIIAILIPLAGFVAFRIFIRYKVIRMGNNQIQIDYPVTRQQKRYPLNQLTWWVENRVKTGKNSEYRELQFRFADGLKIGIGEKEHTEYGKMIQYLTQKAAAKKAILR